MRKLVVVALTSSAFGGVIGALATAATQSQASPAAIASAVQHVQDQKAEGTLRSINGQLGAIKSNLGMLSTALHSPTGGSLALLSTVAQDLFSICQENSSGPFGVQCNGNGVP